jgi:flagellar biosynthesis protein FlhF
MRRNVMISQSADSGPYQALYRKLEDSDFPEDYIREQLDVALESSNDPERLSDIVSDLLVSELSAMTVPGLEFQPGDRLLFVGPVASGKTSAVGKLAARLVLNGKHKIALASLDNIKIGAHDEIQSYAELLGLDVVDIFGLKQPPETDNDTITLIDSPPVPLQENRLETLQKKIEVLEPTHCFATFSALTRSSDITDIFDRIQSLRPTHLIMTMLDLTARYGSIVAACQTSGLQVAYSTDTPGGMGAIGTIDPSQLVRKFLDREVEYV